MILPRQAHVSKATIYKYFKNKTEIFNHVIDAESEELLAVIKEAVDKESTVQGKLRAHLLTRMERIQDFTNFYRVTQESWGDYWPYINRIRKDFIIGEKEIVRNILDLGNNNGELSVKNVDLAAHIMVIGLTSVEYQWVMAEKGISPTVFIDKMLEMMLHGILKR